jgi:chaperonin GroES
MLVNITDIRLLDDRILVRRVDRGEYETVVGIIIPDPAVELGDCAEVVAVGPGSYPKLTKEQRQRLNGQPRQRQPIDLEVGTTVVINRYAGTDITINDETYLILRAGDVLGIVDETKKVELQ